MPDIIIQDKLHIHIHPSTNPIKNIHKKINLKSSVFAHLIFLPSLLPPIFN